VIISRELQKPLREEYGLYVHDACDRCGQILGAVRFTHFGDSGVWCSRECRGDGDRRTIRRGGRPRKYKSENDRLHAERRQNAERQKAFRGRVRRNGKPSPSFAETKDLEAQKTHLGHYPLTRSILGL
jgi:hypothetical protein